jgi:hypothetical protein
MSCKDYLELKPGMKVKLSYEPWGYKDVDAVIDSVDVNYHYDEAHNCGVFHPVVVCYVGKYRMTFKGPINWETLVIKPCRKIDVTKLCVGDVIESNNERGIVVTKNSSGVSVDVMWFDDGNKKYHTITYCCDIKDAEIVGHVDLWNL